MIRKAYLNQYGLMIIESGNCYVIFFNGLYLKLNCNKINIAEFDSIMFYEMLKDD